MRKLATIALGLAAAALFGVSARTQGVVKIGLIDNTDLPGLPAII